MKDMVRWLAAGLVACALAPTASAKTPDGLTPAQEQVCTAAGLTGKLWGLCNAYCEAMDCDSSLHRASEQGCRSVLRNFKKQSEGHVPPCVGSHESGPDEE